MRNKKKIVSLALALASVSGTMAGAVTTNSKIFAEESSVEVKGLLKVVEQLKKLERIDGYSSLYNDSVDSLKTLADTYTEENIKTMPKKDIEAITKILKEVEKVFANKVNDIKLEKTLLETAKENKETSYDTEYLLVDFLDKESKKIENNEGHNVKAAEKKVKRLEEYFNTIDNSDYLTKSKVATEIAKASKELETAQTAYLKAQNDLMVKVLKVESAKKVETALTGIVSRARIEHEIYIKNKAMETAQKEYLALSSLSGAYKDENAFNKAKEKAEKDLEKLVQDVTDRVNLQVTEDNKLTTEEVTKFLAEDKDFVKENPSKVVLLRNVKAEEKVKDYKDLKVKVDALSKGYAQVANVEEAAKKYEKASKSLKDSMKEKEEVEKRLKRSEKDLNFLGDSKEAMSFYNKAISYNEVVKLVTEKVKEVRDAVEEAKLEVEKAKNDLAEKEKALKEDTENVVLKTERDLAVKTLETKEKALKEKEKDLKTVQENLDKLNKEYRELFATFKDYFKKVTSGLGRSEVEALREIIKEKIDRINELGKELNLPQVQLQEVQKKKEWKQLTDGTWRYITEDGKDVFVGQWGKVDGKWYYFDKTGKMLSNQWLKDNEKWYWLKSSGAMASDEWVSVKGNWFWANTSGSIAESSWVYVNGTWYYAKSGGYIIQNAWSYINGKWYHFNGSGALSVSTMVGKYKVNENGEWVA